MDVSPELVEKLMAEGAVPVAQLTHLVLGPNGKPRAVETLSRWIRRGWLEGFRDPSGVHRTSRAALARCMAGRGIQPIGIEGL